MWPDWAIFKGPCKKISTKSSPNTWVTFWSILKNISFYLKSWCGNFLGNFGENWVIFILPSVHTDLDILYHFIYETCAIVAPYFNKWTLLGPFLLYFCLIQRENSKFMFKKSCRCPGFEPASTGIWCKRGANCATTTAPSFPIRVGGWVGGWKDHFKSLFEQSILYICYDLVYSQCNRKVGTAQR